MLEELEILKKEFERIKKIGYVKSCKWGADSIRNTFLVCCHYDFHHLKINMKTDLTRNHVKLFLAIPKGKSDHEVKRLRDTYGECDPILKKAKTLNVCVRANSSTLVGSRFLFKLDLDYEQERIYLSVTDQNMTIHDRSTYWDFYDVKKKLERKLDHVVLVKSWLQNVNGEDYYKFYDYDFYRLKSFDSFLKLLGDGTICISFHVDIYRNGAKMGAMKDSGTYFEIQELDLEKLYQRIK